MCLCVVSLDGHPVFSGRACSGGFLEPGSILQGYHGDNSVLVVELVEAVQISIFCGILLFHASIMRMHQIALGL